MSIKKEIDLERVCEKLKVPYLVGVDIKLIEQNICDKIDELIIFNEQISKDRDYLQKELDEIEWEIQHLANRF